MVQRGAGAGARVRRGRLHCQLAACFPDCLRLQPKSGMQQEAWLPSVQGTAYAAVELLAREHRRTAKQACEHRSATAAPAAAAGASSAHELLHHVIAHKEQAAGRHTEVTAANHQQQQHPPAPASPHCRWLAGTGRAVHRPQQRRLRACACPPRGSCLRLVGHNSQGRQMRVFIPGGVKQLDIAAAAPGRGADEQLARGHRRTMRSGAASIGQQHGQ